MHIAVVQGEKTQTSQKSRDVKKNIGFIVQEAQLDNHDQ